MHFVWTFNGRSDLGLEITNKISLLSWIFLQFDQFIITFRFTFLLSWRPEGPLEHVKSKSRFLILNWFQL